MQPNTHNTALNTEEDIQIKLLRHNHLHRSFWILILTLQYQRLVQEQVLAQTRVAIEVHLLHLYRLQLTKDSRFHSHQSPPIFFFFQLFVRDQFQRAIFPLIVPKYLPASNLYNIYLSYNNMEANKFQHFECTCKRPIENRNIYCTVCLDRENKVLLQNIKSTNDQREFLKQIIQTPAISLNNEVEGDNLNKIPKKINDLQSEERELMKILEQYQNAYEGLVEENKNLSNSVYDYQSSFRNIFFSEGKDQMETHEKLENEEMKNAKLIEQKEKLKKNNVLFQLFHIQTDELKKVGILNGQIINYKNMHKLLPLIQYILVYGSREKYEKKVVSLIDVQELVIVVKKLSLTGKLSQTEIPIRFETQYQTIPWLQCVIEQVYYFSNFIGVSKSLRHKMESKSIGDKNLKTDYEYTIYYLIRNISSLLKWMQDYS